MGSFSRAGSLACCSPPVDCAGSILAAITGGHDAPALRQLILTDFTVECELQTGGLNQRCGLGEFVQEQNSISGARQKRWGTPYRPIAIEPGQATKIHWVKQCGSNIDQAKAKRARGLLYDA